jgi:hypothetical protein
MAPRTITREEFDVAMEAVWAELQYQNQLDRRTSDEAKSVPGFTTLGRHYLAKTEEAWVSQAAIETTGQVEEALEGLRKLAGIFVRGMIYCGIRKRG